MLESLALPEEFTVEIQYVLVIFGMFIVSRYLQRFKLPSAITCLGLGVLFGMGFGIFRDEATVQVLAVLGIVAMFLFAGMEINFTLLRRSGGVIAQHLVIQAAMIGAVAYGVSNLLNIGARPSLLVSLALVTPSTGFILDSLPCLPINEDERFWIKAKALSTEIVALLILFFVMQSASPQKMAISLTAMLLMVLILPYLFKVFASLILPYAPKTEFAFLLIIALISAAITKKMGVYYLVGAFLVGIVQQRVRVKVPTLDSPHLIYAVEFFASFFIPFYFFKAGLALRPDNFTLGAFLIGALFLLTIIPLRTLTAALHRKLVLGEPFGNGTRVGVALLPTLVFTLILAEILRDSYNAPPELIGGLVVFTIVDTMLPALLLERHKRIECPGESVTIEA